MTRVAIRTIIPCDAAGKPESGRRIDPGDRCVIGERKGALWPVSYPISRGTRSAWLSSLDGMAAVYCQRDYPQVPYPAPNYNSATVKTSGCGPTSAAVIVETLRPGTAFDPVAAAAFARACGARVSGGTDMKVLARRVGEKFGLSIGTTSSLSALRAHLAGGGLAVANADGSGMFSDGGHFLVVLDEHDGLLTLVDPGYYGGKYGSRYPARQKAVKVLGTGTSVLLRCAPNVLDADCTGRSPRYYLFGGK